MVMRQGSVLCRSNEDKEAAGQEGKGHRDLEVLKKDAGPSRQLLGGGKLIIYRPRRAQKRGMGEGGGRRGKERYSHGCSRPEV